MEKLSQRLQMIADNILKGETMADIGTDHGFLPIYLLLKRDCPLAIMADINRGPLENAKKNFDISLAETGDDFRGRADFRLGSGIEVLSCGEVDTVVIAGMGGRMMIEILQKDFEKTCSFKRYILQPRNGVGHLRHWLLEAGFVIEKELLVRELDNICNILVVSCGNGEMRNHIVGSDWFRTFEPAPEEEFPSSLTAADASLCIEYLAEKLEKYKRIATEIKEKAAEDDSKQKFSYVNQIAEHLERMVAKI